MGRGEHEVKMKLAWLTDIHLNLASRLERRKFFNTISALECDALLIGGDIGESDSVCRYQRDLDALVPCNAYFVLGNHDYYRSSILQVRVEVSKLTRSSHRLHFLPDVKIVELTSKTALLGDGCWADGRFGDFRGSEVLLSDYIWIQEFNPALFIMSGGNELTSPHPGASISTGQYAKRTGLNIMQALGDEAARHIDHCLSKALKYYENLILLSHVPHFIEACWHEGLPCSEEILPHYSCKAVGDVLNRRAVLHRSKQIQVFCGHTHSGGEVWIAENLVVRADTAIYGYPDIQCTLEVA